MKHECPTCSKEIRSRDSSKRFCSTECRHSHRDEEFQKRLDAGTLTTAGTLRRFLLRKFGHRCSKCQLTHWQGQLIPLNLDHEDGNSENNFESNLRFLCLNCDGLTSTYAGKNRGKGRTWRRERYKKVCRLNIKSDAPLS